MLVLRLNPSSFSRDRVWQRKPTFVLSVCCLLQLASGLQDFNPPSFGFGSKAKAQDESFTGSPNILPFPLTHPHCMGVTPESKVEGCSELGLSRALLWQPVDNTDRHHRQTHPIGPHFNLRIRPPRTSQKNWGRQVLKSSLVEHLC